MTKIKSDFIIFRLFCLMNLISTSYLIFSFVFLSYIYEIFELQANKIIVLIYIKKSKLWIKLILIFI